MTQQKRCVLVVDDTPGNIMLLNIILKKNYAVKGVPSGEIALKIVRAAPSSVDLVLLDVMMPGIDGFEVCRQLKDDPETTDIPIIFISGKEGAADREKGLALGAVAFIGKPIVAETVLEMVARHLPEA